MIRVILIAVLLSLVGCKKKDSDSEDSNITTTNSTQYTPQISPDPFENYQIVFTSYIDTFDNSLIHGPPWNQFQFSTNNTNAVHLYNDETNITHTVSISGIICKAAFNSTISPYTDLFSDTTITRFNSGLVWKISSCVHFPGFEDTTQTGYPQFFNLHLPDTIYKTKDLVLDLNGVNNINYISFYAMAPVNLGNRYYSGSENQIKIPSSYLSSATDNLAQLVFGFSRRKTKTINGKKILFDQECYHTKVVHLLN